MADRKDGIAEEKRRYGVKNIMIKAGITALAVAGAVSLYEGLLIEHCNYSYSTSGETFQNPMMGFAPSADYAEAVGENTLVYVDVTWRELEPVEGQYDFAGINAENHLEEWKAMGKKVVFRFVCDRPSEEAHMDIPDWLYGKTGDGSFYDMDYGKGYSPDYRNETLIAYHKKAIEALGREYGQDSFFCYVELGSVGHWGEWHVKYDEGLARIPEEQVCRQYITPYLDAFPHAKLLMRRPFEAVREYGLGVYNDMAGYEKDTGEWLTWIQEGAVYDEAEQTLTLPACPQIWNRAPVGGEFTSRISMEEILSGEKERTKALLQSSHMTFIGPKCPQACEEELLYPQEVDEIRRNLGYRYGVTDASIRYNRLTGYAEVSFRLTNYGTAPMYFEWPVCLYQLDGNGQVAERFETDIRLTELCQGMSEKVKVRMKVGRQEGSREMPFIAVGIENPESGETEVYLDMKAESIGRKYILNADRVKNGKRG
ncbi:MAG: DUF4832 domain-containing protein [Lachnospiraceae bacterium]|nr:DUF4832 domain-containing protein [Lachnospiraceae bacterium]